jgi:hypothetical protein
MMVIAFAAKRRDHLTVQVPEGVALRLSMVRTCSAVVFQ